MTVDSQGNLYFSDQGTHTVRKVDRAGMITTIAGTGLAGYEGDCGPATSARLRRPSGIAVQGDLLYIADEGNLRIRVVRL